MLFFLVCSIKCFGQNFVIDHFNDSIKAEFETILLKYEVTKNIVAKDIILTRTIQFYLDHKSQIPLAYRKFYEGIYIDLIHLRKLLYKRNWKNHNDTLNKIRLKIIIQ